jgi:hypothetical protein
MTLISVIRRADHAHFLRRLEGKVEVLKPSEGNKRLWLFRFSSGYFKRVLGVERIEIEQVRPIDAHMHASQMYQ